MKTLELKKLIKEAVREVLKEELAELGKQKLNESVTHGLSYTPPTPSTNHEAWPTMNFNTSNTNPALRNSLMEKMGIADAMKPEAPKTFGEKQAMYSDLLSQVAAEMRSNPADLNNFRSVQ